MHMQMQIFTLKDESPTSGVHNVTINDFLMFCILKEHLKH